MPITRTLRILAALLALLVWLPMPALAQPSTAYVKRLAELETLTAALSTRLEAQAQLLAVQAKQIEALGSTVTSQALTVDALRTALDAEVSYRSNHVDIAVNNALVAAHQYTDSKTNPLIDKLVHVSRNGNNVYITGANLHVRNGLGATLQNGVNGLGNLIVGYNEPRGQPANPDVRSGSHNIVTGTGSNYSRTSAFITGINNATNNHFASVLGGTGNIANGTYSVVVGGYNNQSNGGWSVILGGRDQVAPNQLTRIP